MNFVGLNKVPSVGAVIHHHQPQGLLFFENRNGIQQVCSVMCAHTIKSHLRRLGNVQLIPYPQW